MSELTESLRNMAEDSMGMEPGDRQVFSEAADRIAELEAEPRRLAGLLADNVDRIAELKAEPARLQEILLRQTKLNTKVINEKIALEAQLKAVQAENEELTMRSMSLEEGSVLVRESEYKRLKAREAGK
jgi:hypothetical protein